jgi:hypothetical protein
MQIDSNCFPIRTQLFSVNLRSDSNCMKKFLIFATIFTLIVVFACCSKKSNNSTSYTVNGLTDVTVMQYQDTTIAVAVAVSFVGGTQEAVTLTPSNLPAGVTVTPASTSGTPTFATTFSFHTDMQSTGSFPITINASSASSGTKTFKFNLIVSPGVPFSYTVATLPDITVQQYIDTTVSIPVNVSLVKGINEQVFLNPGSIPSGMSMSPASNSGMAPFTSTFSLHVSATNTPGTYPVTVKSSSSSTTTQTHTFNVIVAPNSNCSPGVVGTYTENTACSFTPLAGYPVGTTPNVHVTSTGTANEVILPAMATLTATLNCGTGAFTTADRVNPDYLISASSGTFSPDTITVNYQVFDNAGKYKGSCATMLTR